MLPRAATSPELARIRLDGQWVELLACIPQPAVVYRALVNGTPAATDELTDITYDTGTGTLANVLPGMTIWVGSTLDAYDVGQGRIRSTPSSTVFHVGEESELNVLDNQFLTVLDEFGLWARPPRTVGATAFMDLDIAYAGQHASPLPVVVMGGPVVLELNGAPSVSAVFDASGSWVPGGGSKTYLWTAPGSSATSGLTSATPTMTYSTAGRYRVSCTVTIGGVPNTRYEYVEVLDAAHPPTTQLQVRSLSGGKSQGGYSFQMTLFAQADPTSVRDRAPVILFTRDHAGSSTGSPNYALGRENILCVGWIDGESIVWSPEQSSVTFTVEGAQAWLDKIIAFTQGVEDVTSTPAAWTQYQNLTLPAMLWHLLTWRSTVAQAIDCIVEPDTRRSVEWQVAATSLWEQIGIIANLSILAPPCTDHLGRLFVLIDSQFRSDRSGVVEVMTLTKADWRPPITLNRVTVPTVAMVDQSGVAWDGATATALFSLSPGHVFKRHGRVQSVQALLLTDQASANTMCGLIAGQANNEYPSIPIQLAANNRLLDFAPDCYVKLTLAAGDTPRGIAFTDKRLIPRSVAWNYDAASGGLLPTWTFEAETFAALAITGDAPATEPVPPPPVCPPGQHPDPVSGLCVDDSEPPPPPGQGDGNTVYVVTNTKIGRTRNFLDASPTWEAIDLTGIGGFPFVDFCLDPYDPAHVGYALTNGALYYSNNLNDVGSAVVWTQILNTLGAPDYFSVTQAVEGFARVSGTIQQNGLLAVMGHRASSTGFHPQKAILFWGALDVAHGTITWTSFDSDAHQFYAGRAPCFALSQNDRDGAGLLIYYGCVTNSTSGHSLLGILPFEAPGAPTPAYRSIASSDFYPDHDVSLPFISGQVSDLKGYIIGEGAAGFNAYVYKTANQFSSVSDISPTVVHSSYADGAGTPEPGYDNTKTSNNRLMVAAANDASTLVILGSQLTSLHAREAPHLLVSTDSGATWANRHNFASFVNHIGLWPYNTDQMYVLGNDTDGYILYSTDGGVSWVDKIGNWAAVFGAGTQPGKEHLGAAFSTDVSRIMIVPVWVAI